MTLPQTTIDRIRKEAEEKYPLFKEDYDGAPIDKDAIRNKVVLLAIEAHVEAAESEAMRAQELVEALRYKLQSMRFTNDALDKLSHSERIEAHGYTECINDTLIWLKQNYGE